MLLCLDVGNSHIFGGVFHNEKLIVKFRHATQVSATADQLGLFLTDLLQQKDITLTSIQQIAISSVVPSLRDALERAAQQYFQVTPFFLESKSLTGSLLTIHTDYPDENGSDLLGGAVAAVTLYPRQNLLIVDLGTITTVVAVTKKCEYLGATFLPGVRTMMKACGDAAAGLISVAVTVPQRALGKNTRESLTAGIYFGQLGAIKELVLRIRQECFDKEPVTIIATGGFAELYAKEQLFDIIANDLILYGIKISYERYQKEQSIIAAKQQSIT